MVLWKWTRTANSRYATLRLCWQGGRHFARLRRHARAEKPLAGGLMTQTTPVDRKLAIKKPYLLLAAFVASLGGFLFGYDINVMIGGLIFVTRHFQLTPM